MYRVCEFEKKNLKTKIQDNEAKATILKAAFSRPNKYKNPTACPQMSKIEPKPKIHEIWRLFMLSNKKK